MHTFMLHWGPWSMPGMSWPEWPPWSMWEWSIVGVVWGKVAGEDG
jgi:hypothetical protein